MKISNVNIGDVVVLRNPDTGDECVAEVRRGGLAGGTKHDVFMAYISDVRGDETLPVVTTTYAEADEAGVSI